MGFYKQQSIKFAILTLVSALTAAAGYHQGVPILVSAGSAVGSIAFIMSAVSLGKDDAEKANARRNP